MPKSYMRPTQLKQKLKGNQAKAIFLKQTRLILLILLGGLGWLTWHNYSQQLFQSKQPQEQISQSSPLIALRSLSVPARASQLKLIASGQNSLIDRHRARYLLAADLIQQRRGQQALSYLQELEQDYPLLHPQILFKIAQAQQQNKQEQAAQRTLENLIKTYPNHPLTANALLLLNQGQSQNEARVMRDFPAHPLSQKIARQRLQQNPDQFPLLLLLAKYSRQPDLNSIRDRLVLEYPGDLTPEDWEAIADGYWRVEEHRKAADAYGYATHTPRNLYRAARGFHRNGNLDQARRAYQRLLREYHDAREAGNALLYLASISSGDEAVVYLEKAIAKFPATAPQAYRSKAIVHERFEKYETANAARQELLHQHSNSLAAAEYRWKTARKLAENGNKEDAWQWMQPVIKSNSEFDFAPKALYWTAKWAQDLGKLADAEKVLTKVIKLYPQSYWAWRSAVMLGWKVGDFDQLRPLSPNLDLAQAYESLPVGSPALQELYFLGQYYDASLLLQSEIKHPQQLSVNEQYTEGVLNLELGQYSAGMQSIWDLTKRENPQQQRQRKLLRQTTTYWQSLFPFPYRDKILQYAQREQINPLLVLSVMRKESTFNPEIDSVVGAVGLMQIVPPTAEWVAQKINLPEYSLTNPEDNIEIGTWYLKHNHQRYEDNSLLAVASYNAGTGNVNDWLTRYDLNDRDRFVEQIPFPETKDYVEGVFGNYWNYLRLYNPEIRQKVNSLILSNPQEK